MATDDLDITELNRRQFDKWLQKEQTHFNPKEWPRAHKVYEQEWARGQAVRNETAADAVRRMGESNIMAGIGLGAGAGLLEMVTVGNTAEIAGKINPKLGGMTEEVINESIKQNPAAAFGGMALGLRGTPAIRGVPISGGALVTTAGVKAAQKALGTRKMISTTLESNFAKRGLAHIANTMAAGGGAVAAYNLANDLGDPHKNLRWRFSETAETLIPGFGDTSFENEIVPWSIVALNLGVSAISAKYAGGWDPALRQMALDIERQTGEQVPTWVFRNKPAGLAWVSHIGKTPGNEDLAQRLISRWWKAVGEMGRAIGKEQGVARKFTARVVESSPEGARLSRESLQALEKSGAALRRQSGYINEKGRLVSGTLKAQRQSAQGRAFRKDGLIKVEPRVASRLYKNFGVALKSIEIAKGKQFSRTSDIGHVIRTIRQFRKMSAKGLSPTVQQLQTMRNMVGDAIKVTDAANPNFVGTAQKRAADAMHHSLVRAVRIMSKDIDDVTSGWVGLRRLEAQLPAYKTPLYSEAELHEFANHPNFLTKYRAIVASKGPESVDAQEIRGWLFGQWITNGMASTTNKLSVAKLERTLNQTGKFNRQNMEELFPGMADRFLSLAKVDEAFYRGLGQAEGSPTASRALKFGVQLAIPAAAGSVLNYFFAEDTHNVIPTLGTVGTGVALAVIARSALHGRAQNLLRAWQEGQAAGIGRTPVMAQTALDLATPEKVAEAQLQEQK